jgi:hypothetical protein
MTLSIDDWLLPAKDLMKRFALGDGRYALRARPEKETDPDA